MALIIELESSEINTGGVTFKFQKSYVKSFKIFSKCLVRIFFENELILYMDAILIFSFKAAYLIETSDNFQEK